MNVVWTWEVVGGITAERDDSGYALEGGAAHESLTSSLSPSPRHKA